MKYILGTILLAALMFSSVGCQRRSESAGAQPYDPEIDAPPSAFPTPTNPFVLDDPAEAPGSTTPAAPEE